MQETPQKNFKKNAASATEECIRKPNSQVTLMNCLSLKHNRHFCNRRLISVTNLRQQELSRNIPDA